MFLPIGDSPNPRGVPLVTLALIAANVAVYVLVSLPLSVTPVDDSDPLLLEYLRVVIDASRRPIPVEEILIQISAYDLFVFRWGFRPADPSLTDLFVSMFLHGGFLHLFGNMLFLWIYGDNVEHRIGSIGYLVGYLATGVAATLFHVAFDPDSALPMVGASGAISGLLGFYFLWFPHNLVRLLVVLFPFLIDVVTLPARILLGLYLIVDNLLPFLITRGAGMGGVAHGAHIGGFIAGLAAAWVLDRRQVLAAPREYRRSPERATPRDAIGAALAEARFGDAATLYFAIPAAETRRLLAPEESLRLARWLRENGHAEAALILYRRHLRDYPSGPGAAEAHLGAGELLLEELGQATSAYQHFLDALESDPSPEIATRAREGMAWIDARQKLPLRSISGRRRAS